MSKQAADITLRRPTITSTQLGIIGKQPNIIRPARSFWEKRIDPAEEIFFHNKEETICFDA